MNYPPETRFYNFLYDNKIVYFHQLVVRKISSAESHLITINEHYALNVQNILATGKGAMLPSPDSKTSTSLP